MKNTKKSEAVALVSKRGPSTSKLIADTLWNGDVDKAERTLYDLRAAGKLAVSKTGDRLSRTWSIPGTIKTSAPVATTPSKNELRQALKVIERALGL